MTAEASLGPYRALSLQFGIRCQHPALRTWLAGAFASMGPTADTPEEHRYEIRQLNGKWVITFDDHPVGPPLTLGRLLPTLTTDLNRRVAETAHDHLVVHAGVIARAGAGATLLVGPSGSGKSTLVATALTRGWAYGGDEHAALRYGSTVVDPVPKPLALKDGSRQRFEDRSSAPEPRPYFEYQLLLGVDELGASIIPASCPVVSVVFPTHEAGAAMTIERFGEGAALVALRSEAFNWTADASRAFDTLAALVRSVPSYRLRYEHAPSALAALEATQSENSRRLPFGP